MESASAEDALGVIERQTPDCMVVDLQMPEMDGLEFLDVLHLKKNITPAIMISEDLQDSTKTKCLDHGAACCMTKPLNKEILLKVIEKIVD